MTKKKQMKYVEKLENRREYLQFMMILHLMRTLNQRHEMEKVPYDEKAEKVRFYQFCEGAYARFLVDQSKVIVEGIAKGKYDINYRFNVKNEKDLISEGYEKKREERNNDIEDSELEEALYGLSAIVNSYAQLVPEDITVLPLLLKTGFESSMEEIATELINASKNQITILGSKENTEYFFDKMLDVDHAYRSAPDYKGLLISTFFSSKNISTNLKKKCIDRYINKGLWNDYSQKFIDEVLTIESVRQDVHFGQALVNAINSKNDILSRYIIENLKSDIYDNPISVTKKDGSHNRYQSFAEHAYLSGMPGLAKEIFEKETFDYGNSFQNYDIATTLFDSAINYGEDYIFGIEIMARYIRATKGKLRLNNADFVTHVTATINKLKNANIPEIIRNYYTVLVGINKDLQDPALAEQIEILKNSYQNPVVKQQKIQRIHDILSEVVQSRASAPIGASLPCNGPVLQKKDKNIK